MINFKMFTERNLLEFNDFKLTYYAVCILTGIIVATIMAIKEAKKFGITKSMVIDGLLVCVPLTLIGARIYYVIFNLDLYDNFAEMIGFTDSGFGLQGLSIIGAIIVAVIFVIFYARYLKVNMYAILDFLAPGLLIGQIFGRWGNFFNREAHGGVIKNVDAMRWIIPGFILNRMEDEYTPGIFYHPTFLYESLWNLVGLVIILVTRRKWKKVKLGDYIGFYLIWYGIGRGLLIEPFRTDPLMLGAIRINVVVPLLFALGGCIFLILKHRNVLKTPYYLDYQNEIAKGLNTQYLFDINCFIDSDKVLSDALSTTKEAYPEATDIVSDSLEIQNYYQACLENAEVSPAYKKLIKRLVSEKILVAIATNTDITTTKYLLTRLGIRDYIYIITDMNTNTFDEYFSKGNLLVVSKDLDYLDKVSKANYKTVFYATNNNDNTLEIAPTYVAYKLIQIYELAYQSTIE